MTQRPLDFGSLYRVSDSARRAYRILNDTVDNVGLLVATGACGIDRSDMRRALDRRDRGVWLEYAMAIGSMAPRALQLELAAAIVDPLDCDVVERRPPMSDHDARVALEAAMDALGPIGQEAKRAALGGRR